MDIKFLKIRQTNRRGGDSSVPIDFGDRRANAIFLLTENGYELGYCVGDEVFFEDRINEKAKPILRKFSISMLQVASIALNVEKASKDGFQEYFDKKGKPWQDRVKQKKQPA